MKSHPCGDHLCMSSRLAESGLVCGDVDRVPVQPIVAKLHDGLFGLFGERPKSCRSVSNAPRLLGCELQATWLRTGKGT